MHKSVPQFIILKNVSRYCMTTTTTIESEHTFDRLLIATNKIDHVFHTSELSETFDYRPPKPNPKLVNKTKIVFTNGVIMYTDTPMEKIIEALGSPPEV